VNRFIIPAMGQSQEENFRSLNLPLILDSPFHRLKVTIESGLPGLGRIESGTGSGVGR